MRRPAAAIVRIEQISGRAQRGTPSDLFFQLAEKYYDEDPSVRADPRLAEANVWYWDDTAGKGTLTAVPVPTRIFGQVMAMRTAQEALRIEEDKTNAIALWLTANVRRESRLGLDIENGDPNVTGELDATRPDIFPRALYYTQAAGPRYAHLVLERAVKDRDTAVALGAIEALRITAGESSLIGTEDYKQPAGRGVAVPRRGGTDAGGVGAGCGVAQDDVCRFGAGRAGARQCVAADRQEAGPGGRRRRAESQPGDGRVTCT